MTTIDAANSVGYLKNIHDEYRTALLNKKYYGARLERFKTITLWLEILIAMGTTGSGVAGLAIWKNGYGITLWAVISGLSIAVTATKPFLGLAAQIERYGKLTGEYATVFDTLRIMEQDIAAKQGLTSEQIETFNQVRKRSADLVQLDDANPDRTLIKGLSIEVNKEIPAEKLWMPRSQVAV